MSKLIYAPWGVVAFFIVLLLVLALAFFRPRGRGDGRTPTVLLAFCGAIALERHGGPWPAIVGLHPSHAFGSLVVLAGLTLLGTAWSAQWEARCEGRPTPAGPHAVVRHPQYIAAHAIMLGLLVLWPGVLGALLLLGSTGWHARRARAEESEMERAQGAAWRSYAAGTHRWRPRLRRRAEASSDARPHTETAAVTPGPGRRAS